MESEQSIQTPGIFDAGAKLFPSDFFKQPPNLDSRNLGKRNIKRAQTREQATRNVSKIKTEKDSGFSSVTPSMIKFSLSSTNNQFFKNRSSTKNSNIPIMDPLKNNSSLDRVRRSVVTPISQSQAFNLMPQSENLDDIKKKQVGSERPSASNAAFRKSLSLLKQKQRHLQQEVIPEESITGIIGKQTLITNRQKQKISPVTRHLKIVSMNSTDEKAKEMERDLHDFSSYIESNINDSKEGDKHDRDKLKLNLDQIMKEAAISDNMDLQKREQIISEIRNLAQDWSKKKLNEDIQQNQPPLEQNFENIKIDVTDDDSENTKKKSTVPIGGEAPDTPTMKKSSRNTVGHSFPAYAQDAEILSKSCMGLVTVTRSDRISQNTSVAQSPTTKGGLQKRAFEDLNIRRVLDRYLSCQKDPNSNLTKSRHPKTDKNARKMNVNHLAQTPFVVRQQQFTNRSKTPLYQYSSHMEQQIKGSQNNMITYAKYLNTPFGSKIQQPPQQSQSPRKFNSSQSPRKILKQPLYQRPSTQLEGQMRRKPRLILNNGNTTAQGSQANTNDRMDTTDRFDKESKSSRKVPVSNLELNNGSVTNVKISTMGKNWQPIEPKALVEIGQQPMRGKSQNQNVRPNKPGNEIAKQLNATARSSVELCNLGTGKTDAKTSTSDFQNLAALTSGVTNFSVRHNSKYHTQIMMESSHKEEGVSNRSQSTSRQDQSLILLKLHQLQKKMRKEQQFARFVKNHTLIESIVEDNKKDSMRTPMTSIRKPVISIDNLQPPDSQEMLNEIKTKTTTSLGPEKIMRDLDKKMLKAEHSLHMQSTVKGKSSIDFDQALDSTTRNNLQPTTRTQTMAKSVRSQDEGVMFAFGQGQSTNLTQEYNQVSNLITLYLETGTDFTKDLLKKQNTKVAEFLQQLLQRFRQAFQSQQQIHERMEREMQLQKIENQNLLRTVLVVEHELAQLRSQEDAYKKLIKEAKDGENKFKDRFSAAQEYLETQGLGDIIRQQLNFAAPEKVDSPSTPQNNKKQTVQFAENEGDDPIDKENPVTTALTSYMSMQLAAHQDREHLKKQMDDRLYQLEFSGVTNSLDEILYNFNNALKGSMLLESQTVETQEQACQDFLDELKQKLTSMQLKTLGKIVNRLHKETTYESVGVQIGEMELNKEMMRENESNQRLISFLREAQFQSDKEVVELGTQIQSLTSKISQQMSKLRELTASNKDKEDRQKEQEQQIIHLEADKEAFERRFKHLYDEIRILRESNKKLTLDLSTSQLAAQSMAIGCDRPHKDSLSGSDESSDEDVQDGPNGKSSTKRGAKAAQGAKDKDGKKKLNKKGGQVESQGPGRLGRQATKKGGVEFVEEGSPNASKNNKLAKQKTMRKQNRSSSVSSENSDVVDTIEANKTSKSKNKRKSRNTSPMRAKIYASPRQTFGQQSDRTCTAGVTSGNLSVMDDPQYLIGSSLDKQKQQEMNRAGFFNLIETQKAGSNQPTSLIMTREGSFSGSANKVLNQCSKPYIKQVQQVNSITQTDQANFFEYILDFLRVVEERINKGEIQPQELLPLDHPASDYQRLEQELIKSQERLRDLQHILGKIASLRNKGGDVFFKGLARTFQTNPVIASKFQNKSHSYDLSLSRIDKKQMNKDLYAFISTRDGPIVPPDDLSLSNSPNRDDQVLGYPRHILDFTIKPEQKKKRK